MPTETVIATYLTSVGDVFNLVDQDGRFNRYFAQCPACPEMFRTGRERQAHEWMQDHLITCGGAR